MSRRKTAGRARVHGVAAEIRQTRPFETPGQEAAVGLLRTADSLRRFIGKTLATRGITNQQFNVLRILRGAGEAGLPTLEIAARMIEAAPGITRLLDRLERKKLIVRWRCPGDRRQVLCRITPAGLALLESLTEALEQTEKAFWQGLKPADVRRLIRLLDAVRKPHRT
jgi:DNA-binding MarR family transcriptional regulator